MRTCIIGNSHVGALKDALDSSRTIDKKSIDLYALPGRDEPRLNLIDGHLYPLSAREPWTTIAGAAKRGLDIAFYDRIVISACGWFAARNEFIRADAQSHPLGCCYCVGWITEDLERPPSNRQFVSAAVFNAVVASYVRSHASIKLAFLLSEHFHGSVLLQPWPAPNRALKLYSRWFVNEWYGRRGPSAWIEFFKAQQLALEAVATELGPRFDLLEYPISAPSPDGFMDAQWIDTLDHWHSNAQYGSLVLDQILARN